MQPAPAYRALGHGWQLAYWPPAAADFGVPPEALGDRAPAPDEALLEELRQKVDFGPERGLEPAATLVRQRPLPYYGGDAERHQLLEIFRLGGPQPERARVVRVTAAGGQTLRWVPLAWTSAAIHDLNAAAGAEFLAGADADRVRDYVDFFAGSIEGEQGTFHVVGLGGCELRPAADGGPARFEVAADVLYAGVTFHCVFRVGRDGSIEMSEDEPFEDAALPAEHRWLVATQRIQSTIRIHVEIAADLFLKCMLAARPESELLDELQRGVDSADTLALWARRGLPLTIRGNVDAPAGTRFEHGWRLGGPFAGRRVVLEGSLGLARCRLEQGLGLSGWTIRQSLRLDHADIRGDLVLDDVRIESLVSHFERQDSEPPLNLRAAEVTGDVRLIRARVAGDARLRYARIRGQLELHASEFDGDFDALGISVVGIYAQPDAAGVPPRVGGTLTLSGASIPGHVQLEPIRVGRDLVIITPAAVGAVYVRRGSPADDDADAGPASGVGGALLMGNLSATGRLEIELEDCGAGIELRNVACASLVVRGCVGPVLAAPGLRAHGDVVCTGLSVTGGAPATARIDLRHARIDGDLEISGPRAHPAEVPGPVSLGGAAVEGQLRLRHLAVRGPLDLCDLTAKRDITLDGVAVDAALAMRHVTCLGNAGLEGAAVRGDVELQHAAINGTLALCTEAGTAPRQARIGGKLMLNALTAGKVVMTGDSWTPAAAARGDGPPGGDRFVRWPAVLGVVAVGLPLAVFALVSAGLAGRALASAVLGTIEYEGDWGPLWIGLKWLFWCGVTAVVLLRGWRVLGAVGDLRRHADPRSILAVDPPPGGAGLAAELGRLWGAALARALLLVALAAVLFATQVWPEVRMEPGADAPSLPGVALVVALACLALLHLRACVAAGYWLSQQPGPRSLWSGVVGTLPALDVAAGVFALLYLGLGAGLPPFLRFGVGLAVTAGLALAAWWLAPRPWASTLRMGFLDAAGDGAGGANANQHRLDAAQATLGFRDWLQVVTLNRLQPAVASHHEAKCSLERARIGNLKIVHPIPDYVDIGNLAVDRWELPENPGDTRSYQYLNLLSHAAEFATDSFTSLERSLRNAGDREAAEVLHRAMRRETQWRERRWAQTAAVLVLSLSGYGTRRARLIGVMSLWLAFTAFWFAADYERSVGISMPQEAEFMQVADDECMPNGRSTHPPAAGPAPERASPPACAVSARAELFNAVLARADAPLERLGHGFALAVRYHVPILAWDIRPFIMPRGTGMWVYVTIVEMVHWILWPILIASLVPAILPRRED